MNKILLTIPFIAACTHPVNNTPPHKPAVDTVKKVIGYVSKWEYSEDEDKMNDAKTFYATITANETLQFSFPYDGGSTLNITLRKNASGTNAIIQVSKGQFISGVYGQNIKVRFDSDKPLTYHCSKSSDYDPKVLFIDNASGFISKLKHADKMLLQVEFYKEGAPTLTFDTKALIWEH